jgi:uncharacterized protein YjbI with pentapeptide repeats
VKIIKPQALGLLSRPFEFRREYLLGLDAIAFIPIGEADCLLPETAMWPFLAEELPPDQPLDAAIPKAHAEFLAIAHAFAPGGKAAPLVEVGIQLGPLIKTLGVAGDRRFTRYGSVTEAVPFISMPVDWAHAFGGNGFADNPLGIGAVPIEGSDGEVYPAPNVFDPKLGTEAHRIPSGFAPVDPLWPARARLAGTHDDAWLKQDFPGFARDIDWRFFNCSAPDQWFPDGLAGAETYAFKNLHPTQPLLRGRLPGIAPRLFLVRKGHEATFEEIPLALTTVWCFPHRERLVLVHHGRARLREEDGADVAYAVLGADRLGALRPASEFRAVLEKRLDRKYGAIHAMRDADLVPQEWLRPDPSLAPPASPAMAQIRARPRRRAERELAAQREAMKARGLDPDKYAQTALPPEQSPPATLEELPAFLAQAEAEAQAQKAKAEADAMAAKAKAAARLAADGLPEDEIRKRLDAKPKGPPSFSAAAVREELAKQVAAMRLKGVLTQDLDAQLASPEFNAQLEQAEATLRATYRLSAQHQDPADRLPSERSAEIRRLVTGDTKSARARYDLHGADLSGLDLSGLDLSGVCLDGADLSATSFAGANLANAVLAHAQMTGCVLEEADLSGANLGRAQLTGASLRRAVLKNSVLAGADLTGASLENADLAGADLGESILTDADFTGVRAPKLLAMKLTLRGLHAPGIVLTKATFIECDLEGADLSAASLDQASFIQCNLAGVQLARARMRKSVFVRQCNLAKANLSRADLAEANLRETSLPGANLADALAERADFSGADLTEAVLTRLRGAGSRWVAANLRGANLHLADLARADMARVNLRGAYLVEVSVYEANLARAQLSEDTVREAMFTTRMCYRPLYQPPESPPA